MSEKIVHFKSLFDNERVGAWDLNGQDVVVEIQAVRASTIGRGDKVSKKPILVFVGKKKPMTCNITNAKTIAQLYGNDTREWVGKRITLYPTLASFGGQEVDAIRVRPHVPKGKANADDFKEADPKVVAEMKAKQDRAAGREPGDEPLDDEERRRRIEAGEDPNDA